MRPLRPLLVLLVAAVAWRCGDDAALRQLPTRVPPGVLAVGSVSLQASHEHALFEPFAQALADRLHEVGIGRGEVVVESSLGQLAERMRRGEVDLVIDSPFPAVLLGRLVGARPLLRRWKDGQAGYRSVVFSRVDGPVQRLEDLQGSMIAFGEPFSTSSFLMPKASLRDRGFVLERYEDVAADVPADRIGYLFSGDSENTLFWVLESRIGAGALNLEYFERLAGSRRGELQVLLTTPEVPRQVVCCRADLDPEVIAAVERVLVGLERDPQGRAALAAFDRTTRFDRFPDGPEAALRPIRELLDFVEEDLGG